MDDPDRHHWLVSAVTTRQRRQLPEVQHLLRMDQAGVQEKGETANSKHPKNIGFAISEPAYPPEDDGGKKEKRKWIE